MRTAMMACCAGIGAVAWAPQLPSALLLLAGWLLTVGFAWRRSHPRIAPIALGLLLGLSWATFYGHGIVRGLLPGALEQQPLWLSGRISGLIDTSERFGRPAQRFTLRVDACQRADGESCGVALHTVQLTTTQTLALASGERWQLPARLKRPHGFANPGGFDFETWQIQQRIGAVGSVTNAAAQRLAPARWWSVDRWRSAARDRLQQRLASLAHGDLLLALLVADDSAIERARWQLFRDTGTIHLFVVSGSHIALTGGLVWWLANLWRRLPWASGSRREQMWCALPALLAATLYALLAGMGLPIQRALIMFAVLIVSVGWRREVRLGDALLFALMLVLLHDPLAARDAGCWFSFVAVAVLGVALTRDGEARDGGGRSRWRWARAQWLIFVSCVPILMLVGSPLTGLSLPANAVAVPLTTLFTLPAALVALLCEPLLPTLAWWCWRGADFSLDVLLQWLELLRAQGAWLIAPLVGSPARLALAALAVGLWMLPRGIGARLLAPALLLPALWPPLSDLPAGAVRVSVFDVGQGLSVLVETKTHRLLYDTGPSFPGGASTAEFAVLPALAQRGVRALDLLMVSHRDNDHAGGADTVRAALTVKEMRVGEALPQSLRTPPRAADFCSAGQRWRWDDVDFTVLSPPAAAGGRGNNRSCVLRVDAGLSSVLLTGDIEARVEASLRDALAPASLLVAPHHGSRTSSTAEFVAVTRPRYVVFSSGYRNRFGHPHPTVVERYRASGAQIFTTAQSGALDFTLRRDGVVSITEFRQERRHYWDEPVKSPTDLTGISGAVLHLLGISRRSASEPAHAQ